MNSIEEFVKVFTLSLGSVIEGIAAIIICLAMIKAVVSYGRNVFAAQDAMNKVMVRLTLGKSLAVALEFLLAADILRTAVAPTWNEIGKLAAIAALRTLLNYFLERELKHSETRS
jgi:uncharacterized membrane protein